MLDRRAFLKSGAIALITVGAGPTFLERAARANGRRPKVLVTIFQRGAMDGLAAVPPLTDPRLQSLRPRLHLPAGGSSLGRSRDRVVDLGNGYGLHPAFGDLLPLYREGVLGVVHGVGSPSSTRSHFDAQDYMETGTPGRKGTPDGWLNRVVGRLGHDTTPFRAVSLTPALPRSLYGNEPALAVTNLRTFDVELPGNHSAAQAAGQGFEALYEQTSQDLLRDTGAETFEAVETLKALDVRNYRPASGADYPSSPLGRALMQIAFLVKSDVGLQVAFAESGGWDTHVQQGSDRGSFAARAGDLARSISAFWHDLGRHRAEVTLMTMTEFGRTVAENGTGGTDHGHGSCLFLLGGEVEGGRVHGSVPKLAPENLFEGRDLPVGLDFRTVFQEVATKHFRLDPGKSLFPGWAVEAPPSHLLG
ncbi:MAG: DUF1501 domain-containing protein [Thermoanaerobaculia bacterium]|nr:DUF1501 domain-containing protein [Thermoanaerobaculia bacterium]